MAKLKVLAGGHPRSPLVAINSPRVLGVTLATALRLAVVLGSRTFAGRLLSRTRTAVPICCRLTERAVSTRNCDIGRFNRGRW